MHGSEPICSSTKLTVQQLNDQFRTTLSGGRILLTSGIQVPGHASVLQILRAVAQFDAFDQSNDPHGEHDFGAIEHEGDTIFWKIDYYDLDLEQGSPDPSDPAVTARVLTIMLAWEY